MTLSIHLSIIQPAGYLHSLGFLDQARYARYQFRRLGAHVTIGKNRLREDAVNIIFGAHLGFPAELKMRHTCVFFNLEQLGECGASVGHAYINLLRSSAVLDYDVRNLAAYGCKEGDVPIVSFQYAPYLNIPNQLPLNERPIDLLFFGSVNERRKSIFDRIEACGVSVARFDHPLYGEERDDYILQSKAVFNCHFYESSRFEQARAFHTLSLGTPVISERTDRTTPPKAFENAVTWVSDQNVESFFRDEFMTPVWHRNAQQQLDSFVGTDPLDQWQLAFSFCHSLWESETGVKSARFWRPKAVHLGSGSCYKPGWLNIDTNEGTEPDLVLDLAQKLQFPISGKTPGGGHVLVEEGTLDRIYLSSGFEKTSDQETLILNLLTLLREGGELIADVPRQGGPFPRLADPASWAALADDHCRHGLLHHRFELAATNAAIGIGDSNAHGLPSSHRVLLRKRGTTPHERTLFRCANVNFGYVASDEPAAYKATPVIEPACGSALAPRDLALELIEDTAQIDRLISIGEFDQALAHMVDCVNATFLQSSVVHHALYYPRLDAQVSRMADILANRQGPIQLRVMKENHLIIATELYRVGGHSKVVEEVARELPNAVLLLTDLFGNRTRNPAAFSWIEDTYHMAQVVDLPRSTLWQSAQELASFVQQLQPTSIWYFNHHQDPIPFIGTLGIKGPRKLLLHHCDHNPSLGATLPQIVHVDITDTLQKACSVRLGAPTELLRLHVSDQGVKGFPNVLGTNYSVVTAGRPGKFARTGDLSLAQIVSTTLSTIQGAHYHIGPLDSDWRQEIVAVLAKRGLNPERFVPLGAVPSLWATLLQIDAAVYIGSAPVSGGRGAVEAQGCGLPVLPFTGFEAGSLLADFSSYADTDLGWADLSSLVAQLRHLGERHSHLSQRARVFYESKFSRDGFRRQVQHLAGSQRFIPAGTPNCEQPVQSLLAPQ